MTIGLSEGEMASFIMEDDQPPHHHQASNQKSAVVVSSGVRLWKATAEWLMAQGGDGEANWGDILEPQQLTQLLWSLGK